MTKPLVVVVTGSPASGKTSVAEDLASALELPLFTKDWLKELMFDEIGWSDVEWSKKVGQAAWELLFGIADRLEATNISYMVEGNFYDEFHRERLAALTRGYASVEVNCTGDVQVLAKRFVERARSGDRHPGHALDKETDEDDFVRIFGSRDWGPFGFADVELQVDTTDAAPVDLTEIIATIRKAADGL
jgi:predicted kinase